MTRIEVIPAYGALTGEQVETSAIKALAVTEAKIGSEAVSAAKVKPGPTPTPSATENTVVEGSAIGVALVKTFAYTGNNVETKVKCKHGFGSQATVAFALKSATKLPSEQPTTPLGKWVNESSTEGTFTFTAAPAAKEEVFVIVMGG